MRAHGLRGEVVVALVTDLEDRLAPGSVLASDRVPLTVVASRPHQGRHLVTFDGVADRTAAEAPGRASRCGPRRWPIRTRCGSTTWSARSCARSGGTERGTVVAVQANPAHDLLVLDDGALVPAVFVVSCDDGVTVIDPPEGLFE